MSYEELVESRKNIGDMTKEELYTYCQGLLDEVWSFEKESESLNKVLAMQVQFAKVLMNNNIKLKSIIKEVREYIEENRDKKTGRLDSRLKRVLEILDKGVDKE